MSGRWEHPKEQTGLCKRVKKRQKGKQSFVLESVTGPFFTEDSSVMVQDLGLGKVAGD